MTISPVSGLQSATKIVSPTAGQGNYTTIQSAITAASSGETILIKPGTYTENLTLKAGVNLVAWDGFPVPINSNVIISGKCTFTAAGGVCIEGITLQTNSDFFLAVTGSAASKVYIRNCYLYALNNAGISYTTSSSSANVNFEYCTGDIGTTGIAYFSHSSAGQLAFNFCTLNNNGASTTTSTQSAGTLRLNNNNAVAFPITTSGSTAIVTAQYTHFNPGVINATAITHNSTAGGSIINACFFETGTASAISIGASASLSLSGKATINTSNASAIAGSGTLNYGDIDFIGSSSTIASGLALTFFQPFKVVVQQFTSSGTYTPTKGMMQCTIEVVGAGGGGGGSTTTAAGSGSVGGGGGGGGYARKTVTAATIGSSQTVTVGTGGTAGAVGGGTGGTGNTSSVGAIVSATGGVGGSGGGTSAVVSFTVGGVGGNGSNGDFNVIGSTGSAGMTATAGAFVCGGNGGGSVLGGGSSTTGTGTQGGVAGTLYGGGGQGAQTSSNNTQFAGGAGAAGLVIITEYVLT